MVARPDIADALLGQTEMVYLMADEPEAMQAFFLRLRNDGALAGWVEKLSTLLSDALAKVTAFGSG